MTDRLKTELRVQAWLRRCAAQGLMATVVRKGDATAGALFIKINRFGRGCEVLSGIIDAEGRPSWLRGSGRAPVPERDADAYLDRQTTYDPDLWIVEIEDPQGRFEIGEPVVDL
jgi:hypothetical protein